MAIKDHHHQRPWYEWPEDIRERHTDAIRSLSEQLDQERRQIKYQQFIFSEQWQALKRYANHKGVR
ncbi:MAG: 4-alpha-glucanotransferase, partial [Gammaproteobacteria bacterium]|nr:4-alpha-glucanotransferase [Gammaproteobacteria bacterium]NIR25720.1 4-alpha-glucanotransferase [Gammaproteobacteria bacterium]NIY19034.1 4-alpha-glucanotransferase [Gammaproteobacteria bacterium]